MKKKIKFELVEQDKISKLSDYVNKVTRALGYKEDCLVTDESIIADFLDLFDEKERVKQIDKAKKKLKVDIDSGDYIWEVAERVKNR